MKETQADFGLLDQAAAAGSAERSVEDGYCTYFRPLDAPLAWASDNRGRGVEIVRPRAANAAPQLGLPTDAKARKQTPLFSGVLKYFPRALIAVAQCSFAGNEQHHPGTPLHWDKSKSTDHEDCLLRHLTDYLLGVEMDRIELEDGTVYETPHLVKVAWRALALLETRLEAEVAT